MRPLDIGLDDQQRHGVIAELRVVIANLAIAQIKTRKVHWDIVGPQFRTLHDMLDEQYEKLGEALDEVAERVRMLGGYPIGTARGFIELASVEESPGEVADATHSLEMLLEDQELMARELRPRIERTASQWGDAGTADLLTRLLQQHEKTAWMLRSFLEGSPVKPDGKIKLPAPATPALG